MNEIETRIRAAIEAAGLTIAAHDCDTSSAVRMRVAESYAIVWSSAPFATRKEQRDHEMHLKTALESTGLHVAVTDAQFCTTFRVGEPAPHDRGFLIDAAEALAGTMRFGRARWWRDIWVGYRPGYPGSGPGDCNDRPGDAPDPAEAWLDIPAFVWVPRPVEGCVEPENWEFDDWSQIVLREEHPDLTCELLDDGTLRMTLEKWPEGYER